jgi:hypothetical protein
MTELGKRKKFNEICVKDLAESRVKNAAGFFG